MKRAAAVLLLASVACGHGRATVDELYRSAVMARRQGRFGAARSSIGRGIALTSGQPQSQSAWRFRLLRADVQLIDNDLADARPVLAAPLPGGVEFDALRFRQQYLRARLKLSEGSLPEALRETERAAANAAGDSEDRFELDDLRGQLLLRLGRWSQGEAVLRDVVAHAGRVGDQYHEALALNDLGMGYLVRQRFDEALPWFERILALAQLESFTLYSKALYNAGICYRRLGQFDRAIAAQQRAVKAYERGGASRERAQALGELGGTLLLRGSTQEGLGYVRSAFEVASLAKLTDDAAIWASNLAAANIDLGDWAQARRYNDEARRLKIARQARDLVYNVLNDAEIAEGLGRPADAERLYDDAVSAHGPPDVTWDAQAGLARVALAQGQPADAARHFEAALEAIEQTRSGLIKPDYKLTFLSRLIRFYQSYIDVLVDEGKPERALEIADASRARVLAEGQGVSVSPHARAAAIQGVARRSGATLLSYWLAPSRSYLWIVTGRGVRLVKLPPAATIEGLVRAYQARLTGPFGDPLVDGDTSGAELFRLLVEPAARSIPAGATVIVVPDGILYGLNFETLPVTGGRRPHYWVEDVDVELAPALSMLTVASDSSGGPPSLLLIGDPVPKPPDFPALVYAADEMSDIARHFPSGQVTRLEHKDATPGAYLAAQPDRFTFVHFAAHATANVESPLDSAIVLSGTDGGYKLHARQVAETPLRAALVTVSACRSAGERAYPGEGLIGFAWAFLRAGARRVVAGLWDVDDRSTAAIMDRLYEGVATGELPARALRRAKLALIEQRGPLARPYYWAPFEIFTVVLPPARGALPARRAQS